MPECDMNRSYFQEAHAYPLRENSLWGILGTVGDILYGADSLRNEYTHIRPRCFVLL